MIIFITGATLLISFIQDKVLLVFAQVTPLLKVKPFNIDFGLTFPQEIRSKLLTITLTSGGELNADLLGSISKVERVEYNITPLIQQNNDDDLCPYLNIKTIEPGDSSLLIPYQPGQSAKGTLTFFKDNSDEWLIELVAPCYKKSCDQDYLARVFLQRSPLPLEENLYGKTLNCEISVQVTKVITRAVRKPRDPFLVNPPRRPFIIQFPF